MENYYKILGVSEEATQEQIKEAYRELAKKYHPDVVGNDEEKIEIFKKICEAYETLSKEEKRQEYDCLRNQNNCDDQNEEDEVDSQNYEDLMRDLDENTKRMAEREAARVIIEEEIDKINLILDAKNELFINSIMDYDPEKFFIDITNLKDIILEYISNLENLSTFIVEIDFYEYKDKIDFAKKKAYSIIEVLPKCKTEVINLYLKEELAKNLEKDIDVHRKKIDDIKKKLKELYEMCTSYLVGYEEYNNTLNEILYDLKDEQSYIMMINELIKNVENKELLERITKVIIDLDIVNTKIIFDYQVATEYGKYKIKAEKLKKLKENIKKRNNKIGYFNTKLNITNRVNRLTEEDVIILQELIENILEVYVNTRNEIIEYYRLDSGVSYLGEYDLAVKQLSSLLNEDNVLKIDIEKIIEKDKSSIPDNYNEFSTSSYNMSQAYQLNARIKNLLDYVNHFKSLVADNNNNNEIINEKDFLLKLRKFTINELEVIVDIIDDDNSFNSSFNLTVNTIDSVFILGLIFADMDLNLKLISSVLFLPISRIVKMIYEERKKCKNFDQLAKQKSIANKMINLILEDKYEDVCDLDSIKQKVLYK